MPANKTPPVEVRPSKPFGWEVVHQGDSRRGATYPTQAEAAKAGRRMAKREQTEFISKGRNNRIRDRSSYGNDPRGRG